MPRPAPPQNTPPSTPWPTGDGQPPVTVAALLRGVVLATRELAGPTWLEASCEHPDMAAFIPLQATASPPDPARIDEICSRALWAQFAPARAAGAGADDDETGCRTSSTR